MHFKLFIFLVFYFSTGVAQQQKNVIFLDNWTDTTIEKGLEDAIFNDIWGFTHESNDYCVMGSSIGSHFFLIEDKNIQFIDFVPGKYQNRYVEHRDFKKYQNYIYGVCDEGTSSLQIIDISYLPDSVSKVYDSALNFQICHNIFIDTLNAKLYAAGPNNIGLKVFSIEDPINPILLHDFNEVAYVHDCYVRDDTAYLNCGFDGLQIYSFEHDTPEHLGNLDFYPNQGYNHSGWLSPNGNKYAFIDETKGTQIKLCNLKETPLNIIAIDELFSTKDYLEYVPHNIIILDYLAFVAYYNEGLRIFDLSKAPYTEIGMYDTFLEDTKYRLNGAWGVFVFEDTNQILISDRQNGLFLFEFPIKELNNNRQNTFFSGSMPFINEGNYLIPREELNMEELYFSIHDIKGTLIYDQENYLNYIQIPLDLSSGTYLYGIFDNKNHIIESGQFIVLHQ